LSARIDHLIRLFRRICTQISGELPRGTPVERCAQRLKTVSR
jgi:hypothetical protein